MLLLAFIFSKLTWSVKQRASLWIFSNKLQDCTVLQHRKLPPFSGKFYYAERQNMFLFTTSVFPVYGVVIRKNTVCIFIAMKTSHLTRRLCYDNQRTLPKCRDVGWRILVACWIATCCFASPWEQDLQQLLIPDLCPLSPLICSPPPKPL